MALSRLVRLAAAAWIVRWLLQEFAAYAGRHWRAPGPPPVESAVVPGAMPLPPEEAPNE
jgi:hypothetical protein